jgi:predicted alpha-1,2-mannosidase
VLVNAGGSQMPDDRAEVQIDPARHEISGSARSGGFCYQDDHYSVYFVAEFDRPFAHWGTWSRALLSPGATQASDIGVRITHVDPIPNVPVTIPGNPSLTARAGAYVGFDAADGGTVRMRVGISFVSVEKARANLHAENPSWDFDAVRDAARARWNRELSRIRVETGDTRLRRMFYTALYHALLAPTLYSDADGEYLGMDDAVHQAGAQPVYGTYSGWDIYRTQWPLLAMLDPQRASDMTQTLVRNAQQSGWLPKWSYANQHTNVMVGDPAAIMIASAYAFGARDFDTAAALDAMIKGATQPAAPAQSLLPGNTGYVERAGLAEYRALGYIPYEENVSGTLMIANGGLIWGSAATTLEYALADFAIDRYADALGQAARTTTLRDSAGNWKNLFNPQTGMIEPRLAVGPFTTLGNPLTGDGFVEGSSAQYTWFVPHDTGELVEKIGGREAAAMRLDEFFSELNGGPTSPHAYLGNEPTLFTPWLYAWVGEPDKTGPLVHEALLGLYDDAPTGLPGNDDLGTMSAWWVLGALGLMPAIPGTDALLLSTPLFERATLSLPGGDLVIRRSGSGDRVQSLRLDGTPLDRAWIRYADIVGGGRLDYSVGATAGDWGRDPLQAPPSYSSSP